MSKSVLVSIADALVLELNAHEFSRQFTAERLYDPERELEELEQLRVDVICGDIETAPASRGGRLGTYRIDIAFREKLDTDDIARVDALGAFVEEVDDYFSVPPRRLTYYSAAAWQPPSKIVYPYLPSHIRQRQFTSLLRLTYKVVQP